MQNTRFLASATRDALAAMVSSMGSSGGTTNVKWFTSAVSAQMALTLARPEGNPAGGKGLAMFYLELRDAEGRLNGLRVDRLKDKLGTRKVPTAELMLEGTRATGNLRPEQIDRANATALLKKAADKDDCADMVVTLCRTGTMTGQTVVIDAGRSFH